jgi:hypothetical protein
MSKDVKKDKCDYTVTVVSTKLSFHSTVYSKLIYLILLHIERHLGLKWVLVY